MEFKTTFFAIILISMMVTAIGIIAGQWGTSYGTGTTSDLNKYDKKSALGDYVKDYQASVNPQSSEASSDTESVTFRGAYGIITGVFQPLRLIGNMFSSLITDYGIDDYVFENIWLMILIGAVFTIIAIIFRQLREYV